MNTETHGNRNLILLGLGAITITVITTCASLYFYRSSGDIYLDRSRPGFLPDKEEVEEEATVHNNYSFSETGELTKTELKEYLNELKELMQYINALENPYSPSPLSDESLGIAALKDTVDDQNTINK